jgi:type I restriction-modification system DNA methylase subunit
VGIVFSASTVFSNVEDSGFTTSGTTAEPCVGSGGLEICAKETLERHRRPKTKNFIRTPRVSDHNKKGACKRPLNFYYVF